MYRFFCAFHCLDFQKVETCFQLQNEGSKGREGGGGGGGNVSEEGGNLNAAANLKFPNRK